MSAARIIESMGASVSLVDGRLRLMGLDRLDRETATRVLVVARANKTEIVAKLRGDTNRTPLHAREESIPVPPDASLLEALYKFERDPHGVVAWLATQPAGQERNPSVRRRFQEYIRAEAQARLAEVAE